MKHIAKFVAAFLVFTPSLRAEPRTFTNKEGKTVDAEPVLLEEADVLLKLANLKVVKVPLDSLSESDQSFLKAWWETNKNKVGEMDIRLKIEKDTERIDNKVTRSGGNHGGNNLQYSPVVTRTSTDEVKFVLELASYTRKDISDISVDYTIYKRTSVRDKKESGVTTDEIDGETSVRLLESHGRETVETDPITCKDFSQTGGKDPRSWKRETVVGIVVTLSASGQDFLKQSYPENLIQRLEEDEERDD